MNLLYYLQLTLHKFLSAIQYSASCSNFFQLFFQPNNHMCNNRITGFGTNRVCFAVHFLPRKFNLRPAASFLLSASKEKLVMTLIADASSVISSLSTINAISSSNLFWSITTCLLSLRDPVHASFYVLLESVPSKFLYFIQSFPPSSGCVFSRSFANSLPSCERIALRFSNAWRTVFCTSSHSRSSVSSSSLVQALRRG